MLYGRPHWGAFGERKRMNEFIKVYNDIFKENGYVHVSADDLRISTRITFSLQKYNETCTKQERITKKLTFNQKYQKLQKSRKDSQIFKELLSLFSFKIECENLSEKIKENEITLGVIFKKKMKLQMLK